MSIQFFANTINPEQLRAEITSSILYSGVLGIYRTELDNNFLIYFQDGLSLAQSGIVQNIINIHNPEVVIHFDPINDLYTKITNVSGVVDNIIASGVGGSQGPPGPMGPSGSIGPVGPIGPSGFPGPQGIQGIQGLIGPQGLQGLQGNEGIQGPVGSVGPSGLQGNIGPVGPQGIQGIPGPSGAQGVVGPQGPQGVIGPSGLQGLTGPQGLQGPQGPIGPSGLTGFTGSQGSIGPIGPSGAQGPIGLQGLQGIQGIIGPIGPSGATGASGSQGPLGPSGLPGPAGIQGIQGIAGPSGLPGPQGQIGPSGLQGLQGIQGIQGPSGLIGPQGPAGAGENNTSSNVGSGVGFVKSKVGVDLPFKSLIGGDGCGLLTQTNEVVIDTMPFMYTIIGAATTWSNEPSVLTEVLGNAFRRIAVDLSKATKFRILACVQTAGAASTVWGVQYSTDSGSTWRGLDNGTLNSNSTQTINFSSTGSKVGSWDNFATGAKADVLLRIVGSSSISTGDPVCNLFAVQFK